MKKLGFIIVGAQKCGTTALAHFLDQHPDIVIAEGKEAHLFDDQDYSPLWTEETMDRFYDNFFDASAEHAMCGEATPLYLYWPEIPQELARYNKHLKIIVMLRDPVDRAISHYEMEKREALENLPMWLAFLLEPIRLRKAGKGRVKHSSRREHSYISRGFYARQIQNLRRYFPNDQILLIEQNQLLQHHKTTMKRVFAFLGFDDDFMPASKQVFTGDIHKRASYLIKTLLSLCYWQANRQLKKLLTKMGYISDWTWL